MNLNNSFNPVGKLKQNKKNPQIKKFLESYCFNPSCTLTLHKSKYLLEP